MGDLSTLFIPPRMLKMNETFADELQAALPKCLSAEFFVSLRGAVATIRGVELPDFMSFPAFENIYTHKIHPKLLEPTLRLTERARDLALNALVSLAVAEFDDFPRLRDAVVAGIRAAVDATWEQLKIHVVNFINAEKEIFTQNHYYTDIIDKVNAAASNPLTPQWAPPPLKVGAAPEPVVTLPVPVGELESDSGVHIYAILHISRRILNRS